MKEPPPGVLTDGEVLGLIADRLGQGERFRWDLDAVQAEFRRATAGGPADYAGISRERIDREEGLFWPCPSEAHPGTPRLFLDRFGTPDGRARFHAVAHRDSAELPDRDYPFHLTTGRVLAQYQSGTQTRRVPQLAEAEPGVFVEIHPETARTLGLGPGDAVRLTTRRGAIVAPARLSRDIRLDTLFVPFHWGGGSSANVLTIAALDPVSRIPEFKVCAVRAERVEAPTSTAVSRDLELA